jgi:hypothetical protein
MLRLITMMILLGVPALAFANHCPNHCLCDHDGNIVSDNRDLHDWHHKDPPPAADPPAPTSAATSNSSSVSTSSATSAATASATGGTASATGGAATAAGGAGGTADASGSNNTDISSNVTIPRQVATAYASSLTSGLDTCLGSTAGGVQTEVLGLSLGSTRVDGNCVLVKQVQLLTQLGYKEAACFRARAGKEGKAIDDAMKQAGVTCEPVPAAPTDAVTHEELTKVMTRVLQK